MYEPVELLSVHDANILILLRLAGSDYNLFSDVILSIISSALSNDRLAIPPYLLAILEVLLNIGGLKRKRNERRNYFLRL
jgi:hypothetical protein